MQINAKTVHLHTFSLFQIHKIIFYMNFIAPKMQMNFPFCVVEFFFFSMSKLKLLV